ncbi:hypothetical protein ACRARG_17515 [Pseudooceanicola sp. C21-150M6]|uniref:tetratricopeptide repeat protein n=1 Tax=Pseudooceanicola sp. C21-150M6 TaxID=3434355 RepID=UPI003D7FECF4
MSETALSRKDRRARQAKASKLYGISGPEALEIHQAYRALNAGDVMQAVQLAHPVALSKPKSEHGWIVLGGAALARREGKTAEAFFARATELNPKESGSLVGLAKAYVLQADPYKAVAAAEKAFGAGADERGLILIYLDLMTQMGRVHTAVDVLGPVVSRLEDAELSLFLADACISIGETKPAADWLNRTWKIDPKPAAHGIAHLRALIYQGRAKEAETFGRELLAEPGFESRDAAIVYLSVVLRLLRRPQDALDLARSHEFTDAENLAEIRGVMANIHQDLGLLDEAEGLFLEAVHIAGRRPGIAKAFGVFLMGRGEFQRGAEYYAERITEGQRNYFRYENSEPENLRGLETLYLIGEQGIGDQLAFLSLLRLAPIDFAKTKIRFVSDGRFEAALKQNVYGLEAVDRHEFEQLGLIPKANELVHIGDFARYIDGTKRSDHHGATVTPDADLVAEIRSKYEGLAQGAPIYGVAWTSGAMMGHLRAVTLEQILDAVPQGAFVVNLQYGDRTSELTAARRARPDLTILDDADIDQMADLAGFFAQVAALDRVVTIDNTTAHVCGAIGHPDTHVLIPTGTPCIWYWSNEGERDPWYGNLNLYRQSRIDDWTDPLNRLKSATLA